MQWATTKVRSVCSQSMTACQQIPVKVWGYVSFFPNCSVPGSPGPLIGDLRLEVHGTAYNLKPAFMTQTTSSPVWINAPEGPSAAININLHVHDERRYLLFVFKVRAHGEVVENKHEFDQIRSAAVRGCPVVLMVLLCFFGYFCVVGS